MGRKVERTIIKPTHAAYGLPTVTCVGLIVSAFVMAVGFFISALVIFAVSHLVSMILRAKFPHGENLLWRQLGKRKGRYDWSGSQRVYHS